MIYALHDYDPKLKEQGAFPISKEEAGKYNKQGYGIFHTPNNFSGPRKKENLERINYWIADVDEEPKEMQTKRIKDLLLKPTILVETKRGFHCYWKAKDATVENYTKIEKGIIHKLNADKGCKDVTRIMRYPGYLHMKDKENPFMVKTITIRKEFYTEKEMVYYFPLPKPKKVKHYYSYDKTKGKEEFKNPANWDKIFKLNRIGKGNRNNEFCRIIFWLRDEGLTSEEIESMIWEMNNRIESLPEREIRTLLRGKT